MNKLKEIIIGGGILLTLIASANANEFSGNVSIGTDYVYRGISQTGEEATIQGGFDWEADNGIYAGIWASNIEFDGYGNPWLARGFDLGKGEFIWYWRKPGTGKGWTELYRQDEDSFEEFTVAELDETKELWILPDEETPASDKSFLDILQNLCHNDN